MLLITLGSCFLLFLHLSESVENCSGMSPEEIFMNHSVVPDVIPLAPPKFMKIVFDNEFEVNCGNELTPTAVRNQPVVTWDAEPDALYTLIMTDPDAPSRKNPIRREFHHWLVSNIQGNDTSSGDVLSAFISSGPPKDTGLHRYVFLVYKQPNRIGDSEHIFLTSNSTNGRANFSTAAFALKHELGNPVAGNFYQAKYDEYVPTVHRMVGLSSSQDKSSIAAVSESRQNDSTSITKHHE